jgi:hypothetical protein
VNGKQKAYVINQNEMATANPEELTSLDTQVLIRIQILFQSFNSVLQLIYQISFAKILETS